MSPSFPPEILDLIADHLHDDRTTLKACCLVSKSWVPRTRRHIFAHIKLDSPELSVKKWMKSFPDPSNSPAHHARSLLISGSDAVGASTTRGLPWIRSFHQVVGLLVVTSQEIPYQASLLPLCGFTTSLRAIRLFYLSIPLPDALELICSFPLLEDVSLYCAVVENDGDRRYTPQTSPRLTGALHLGGESHPIARGLSDLPGGLHFSDITILYLKEGHESTMDVIRSCSNTLESLWIGCWPENTPKMPLDLSKATKLKDIEFLWTTSDVQWITMALRTAKSKTLQQISIRSSATFADFIGKDVCREWQDLDHQLVQLLTSRSVDLKITYLEAWNGNDLGGFATLLLPELTRRGIVCKVDRD